MPGDLNNSDPSRLAPLLESVAGGAAPSLAWGPDELAAVLRHQLAVPLRLDLGEPLTALSRRLEESVAYRGLAGKTLGQLLHDPHPPAGALELVKQFAKAHRTRRDGLLPREVATVLYYAAILVARTRCGVRLSTLDDRVLRDGAAWAAGLAWVDDDTRAMFAEAGKARDDSHAGPAAET